MASNALPVNEACSAASSAKSSAPSTGPAEKETLPAVPSSFDEMHRLYHADRLPEAAAMGWEMLRVDPRDPLLLNLLALAEHRLGNNGAAIVLLQRALKANPDGYAHLNDMGNVYLAAGAFEEAEKAYLRAIECYPRLPEAYNNLGVLEGDRRNFEEARRLYEHALQLKPDYAEALCNIGIVMGSLGKYQKAIRRYEQALKIHPDLPKARFNLSLFRLLLGDMAGGWREWDSRWLHPQLASSKRDFAEPRWRGEMLAGKRILLYAEQGVGDTLQFVRYLPLVAARGGTIVLEVQASLIPLLAPLLPEWVRPSVGRSQPVTPVRNVEIVAQKEPLPLFDVQFPLMSLPVIFGTTLSTIPSPKGYVRPASRSTPTAARDRLRVGLVWAGSPTHKLDMERSMPLSAIRPLLDLPGISWISLQKGPAAAQIAELAVTDARFGLIEDAATCFENYADTAAAVDDLDLVITVDTSVAHLAGAMGKPVWILLQAYLPDWRWMLKRKDSPWYHSARLFRQSTAGDWTGLIDAVAGELQQLHARAALVGGSCAGTKVEVALGHAV